jgi:hypothetical protein
VPDWFGVGGGANRKWFGLKLRFIFGIELELGCGFRLELGIGAERGLGLEFSRVRAVEGGANGFAPGVGAEGVDVFVLGEMNGLEEGLGHVG